MGRRAGVRIGGVMLRMRWLLGLAMIAGGMADEAPAGLDGATGHVFKVDPAAKSFELLKETEYDPKTYAATSRFTVRWTDDTSVVKLGEWRDFSALGAPARVEFRGIDAGNFTALEAGKPFVARVATVFAGSPADGETGVFKDENRVVGWFRPEGGKRAGTLEIGGRTWTVSLRERNWRIFVREPVEPARLAQGFWKVTLHGADAGGGFVAASMEVEPLPDPRETDDPKLPRVLVIGDSISMNYHEAAKKALEGVANYHRIGDNGGPSERGVRNVELWLGNHREEGFGWDVIQFNHGLHDLKQAYDAKTDTFGAYAVSPADYQANLEKEIAILKKTGAKLIWCTTTPVPNHNKGQYARRKGASKDFNALAMEVIKRHPEIAVTDLHAVVDGSPVFDAWRKTQDVHFYKPAEQQALGEAVAAGIRKALE